MRGLEAQYAGTLDATRLFIACVCGQHPMPVAFSWEMLAYAVEVRKEKRRG